MLNKTPPLLTQELSSLSEVFRLLADPSRLRILIQCKNGPKSVTEISETLELSQSLVSHHLRHLRAARLVTRIRRAKQMIYEITDLHVRDAVFDLLSHVREQIDPEIDPNSYQSGPQ